VPRGKVCCAVCCVLCCDVCCHPQGMVTHVTDVKPLAAVLTYLDQDSNTEVYQEVRAYHTLRGGGRGDGPIIATVTAVTVLTTTLIAGK